MSKFGFQETSYDTDKVIEMFPAIANYDAEDSVRQRFVNNPMAYAFFKVTGLIPLGQSPRKSVII